MSSLSTDQLLFTASTILLPAFITLVSEDLMPLTHSVDIQQIPIFEIFLLHLLSFRICQVSR